MKTPSPSMSHRLFARSFMVAGLCLWAPKGVASPSQDIQGTFLPVEDADVLRTITNEAVDKASVQFSLVIRALAKAKLRKSVQWCPSYTVALTQTHFDLRCQDKADLQLPLNHEGDLFIEQDGKAFLANLRVEGSTVFLRLKGDGGGKAVTYHFGREGQLRVEFEVFSALLAPSMTWELAYQRSELP